MLWKIVISAKIQRNKALINAKKNEEKQEWLSFKMKASKNEDINVNADV